MLGALEAEPFGVVHRRAGLHAQQGVVGQVVLLPGVMAVVGSQQRRPQAMGDLDKLRVGLALLLQPVVLQLDEQVVPPEDVLEPGGTRSGELHVTAQQGLVDEAPEAPGGRR